mmetsp:Transcript_26004/g.44641  ORF Transcript_26004/g.44641 Transcript_26004/m.44641 type:complete len:259 (+) Transcript_26004:176-952(+)
MIRAPALVANPVVGALLRVVQQTTAVATGNALHPLGERCFAFLERSLDEWLVPLGGLVLVHRAGHNLQRAALHVHTRQLQGLLVVFFGLEGHVGQTTALFWCVFEHNQLDVFALQIRSKSLLLEDINHRGSLHLKWKTRHKRCEGNRRLCCLRISCRCNDLRFELRFGHHFRLFFLFRCLYNLDLLGLFCLFLFDGFCTVVNGMIVHHSTRFAHISGGKGFLGLSRGSLRLWCLALLLNHLLCIIVLFKASLSHSDPK